MRRRSRVSVDDGTNGLQVLASPADPGGGTEGDTGPKRWDATKLDELIDALTRAEERARVAEDTVAQLQAKLAEQVRGREGGNNNRQQTTERKGTKPRPDSE